MNPNLKQIEVAASEIKESFQDFRENGISGLMAYDELEALKDLKNLEEKVLNALRMAYKLLQDKP
jgi:hypothetical protein